MKKRSAKFIFLVLACVFALSVMLAGCSSGVPGTEEPVTETVCEHTYGSWKIQTAAGCDWDGAKYRKCTKCGEVETRGIPATGHTYVKTDGRAVTCADVSVTNVYCSKCKNVYSGPVADIGIDHIPVVVPGVAPTVTATGLTDGKACAVCNKTLVAREVLPKLTAADVAHTVNFNCGSGVTLKVYEKADYSGSGSNATTAYTRNASGQLAKGSTAQVNFKLTAGFAFKPVVTVEGAGNSRVLGPEDTGVAGGYRITNISDDITVNIAAGADSLGFPAIMINTAGGQAINSKENYVACTVDVTDSVHMLGTSKYDFTGAAAKIRGRGNSTWGMPKKPYKLKFDKKTDLFGNGKAKTWTLIANYCDPSLVRNYFAYRIAEMFPTQQYTTKCQTVDLYLNGKYQGVYLVCEQNETGTNRVEINEDMALYSPEQIGYLIELDARAAGEGARDVDYFVLDGKNYVIKTPDTGESLYLRDSNGNGTSDYLDYVKQYLNTTYNTVRGSNYAAVTACIDVESFAESYVVHELFNNIDVGYASFYMYIQNGVMHSGPLWDFDISSGNCNYEIETAKPNKIYCTRNPWYDRLLKFSEFRQLVKRKLDLYGDTIYTLINTLTNEVLGMAPAFERNFNVWNILGKYVWPNTDEVVAIKTWSGQVEYLRSWLFQSLTFLRGYYV